jgi:uncharacterized protein
VHTVLNPAFGNAIPPKRCALGIMTKAPEPGKVKTRLTPPLTPVESAEINKCFLRDLGQAITSAAESSPGIGVGVYTPKGSESAYADILPPEFLLLPQRGTDFGERLIFAAEDLFTVGFESVCLINSDSPTVPASSFASAANELAKAGERIVLGPSDDGGYYLIGLKKPNRMLFEEIDWSTERVFQQTMARAAEIGIEVKLLPTGFDVDDGVTLQRLWSEIAEENSASPSIAPHTSFYLRGLVERKGSQLFAN